jgi:holo-[acyl-carrier protein] synthase
MAILGIGTEIVECLRIQKMIETHGEQFLERVYTADEIEYCLGSPRSNAHFATRWAAKEATIKAMRCRRKGVRWTEIEILAVAGEGTMIVLEGTAARWAEQNGIQKLHVTIAACRTHATAFVIATDEPE